MRSNRQRTVDREIAGSRVTPVLVLTLLMVLAAGWATNALECEGGNANGGAVLRTITCDGDPSDWAPVLSGGVQVTMDGDGSSMDPGECGTLSSDRDCPVGQAGRDMNRFTWTYDSERIYLYQTRYGSVSNIQIFFFYMDVDLDRHMGTTDFILRVSYQGSNRSTKFQLYRFVPSDGVTPDPMECPAGDPTCDEGYADGYAMPGYYVAISDPSCLTCTEQDEDFGFNVNGSGYSLDGEGFEVYVPWSDLGFSEPTPIYFHVSGTNPAGQILDNCGNPDGRIGYFGFHGVDIEASSSLSMGVPASDDIASYAHSVTNSGLFENDIMNLAGSSTMGFRIDFYDLDGGTTLMATDANGDGTFDDIGLGDWVDTVNYDTDGDGFPDTGALARGVGFDLGIDVTIPAGTAAADETVIVASVSGYGADDCVTDTTTVGNIDVSPDRDLAGTAGSAVDFSHSVIHYLATDFVNLTAASAEGWTAAFYSDPEGDGVPNDLLADNDGDGNPDTGALAANTPFHFVMQVTAGGSTGVTDTITVTATTTGANGYARDTCTDTLEVLDRITITPDHLIADGENYFGPQGYSVYVPHEVSNSHSDPDVGELTDALTENGTPVTWDVVYWSDPNCDGNISDGDVLTPEETGEMEANGGKECIVAELLIPTGASDGATVRMDITATSQSDANPTPASDTARDEIIVSQMMTFESNYFVRQTDDFTTCDTIYVKGFNWTPADVYFLHFFDVYPTSDASGSIRLVVNGLGEFTESYAVDAAADLPGTWTVELRDTDDTTVLKTLTINVSELAPTVMGPLSSCPRQTVKLEAEEGFAAYSWSPGGETSRTLIVAPETTTTYACTVTDENGCEGTSGGHTVAVGSCVNLLRNAEKITLSSPANSEIFRVGEPALTPGTDDEVLGFTSGTNFPHDTLDMETTSCPLVFYELEGEAGDTLRVAKSGGKIVITY